MRDNEREKGERTGVDNIYEKYNSATKMSEKLGARFNQVVSLKFKLWRQSVLDARFSEIGESVLSFLWSL